MRLQCLSSVRGLKQSRLHAGEHDAHGAVGAAGVGADPVCAQLAVAPLRQPRREALRAGLPPGLRPLLPARWCAKLLRNRRLVMAPGLCRTVQPTCPGATPTIGLPFDAVFL